LKNSSDKVEEGDLCLSLNLWNNSSALLFGHPGTTPTTSKAVFFFELKL